MSAADRLLDARWRQLESDLAELDQVRSFLDGKAAEEKAARDLLSNLAAARTYEGVLTALAERSRTALEEARATTGWTPPSADDTQALAVRPDDATALQHLESSEVRRAVEG